MQASLLFLIITTLIFFALNSLLAKATLINNYSDPYSFTLLRVFFGSLVLVFLVYIKEKKVQISFKSNYISSLMLFIYALFFSYAYISLDAGLGALILFAFVQLTIIIYSLIKKENFNLQKVLGIVMSFAGLIYLLYPDEKFELSLFHFILMMISGIAWGVYTILGKGSLNPILNTMDNFTKATLIALVTFFIISPTLNITANGIILAFISGGITSALGYALWYYLLPQLQTITSGLIQLLVPPIAIVLSIVFLDEELSIKLVLSTGIILLGILISMKSNKH